MGDHSTAASPQNLCSAVSALAPTRAREADEGELPEPVDDEARLSLLKPWQRKFIEQLRRVPNVTLAARAANFTPQGARKWRRPGQELFTELWDEALEGCVDAVEGALYEEGAVGRERVVYGKDGEVKSTERVRDVNAMKFYLAGRRSDVFREKTGPIGREAFETTEDAVMKALGAGLLAGIGAKLAERFGKSVENEAAEVETL